jgi:hypothetical protein
MRRDLDETGELRRVSFRETRVPLWRRVVTVLVAAAFTVAAISLGLMRHGHFRHDSDIPHPKPFQNGSQP